MVPEWMQYGNCAGLPRDTFFAEDSLDQANAIRICGFCEVKAECLQYAFQAECTTSEGIYGGTTGAERKAYAKEHGIKPTLTNKQMMQMIAQDWDTLQSREEV